MEKKKRSSIPQRQKKCDNINQARNKGHKKKKKRHRQQLKQKMEKEIGMLSILSKNKIVHMLAHNTKKNEPEDAVATDNRKLV